MSSWAIYDIWFCLNLKTFKFFLTFNGRSGKYLNIFSSIWSVCKLDEIVSSPVKSESSLRLLSLSCSQWRSDVLHENEWMCLRLLCLHAKSPTLHTIETLSAKILLVFENRTLYLFRALQCLEKHREGYSIKWNHLEFLIHHLNLESQLADFLKEPIHSAEPREMLTAQLYEFCLLSNLTMWD